MLRLCVARVWVGACVLALQNDGGPGPGLMRCFRDDASRRVDMWFGRRLYAIFLLIILNHIIQRFLHTLLPLAATPTSLPPIAPVLSAVFSYPQSGGWQWQIEEHQSSISTWLEGQIITGYFPLLLKSPTYSCGTIECIKAFILRSLCQFTDNTLCAPSQGSVFHAIRSK